MAGLISLRRALWAGLAVAGALAAFDGWRWQRDATINAQLAAGHAPAGSTVPQLRFAAAYAQAASGAEEAAINAYRPLQGDGPLGQAARFNSANGLLRQAIVLREGPQPGLAVPLIELAKETYREVLRNQPQHWPARYNLERAQRLLPDPEDLDGGPLEVPRNAERAATTMRGYSPGLP
jgi:mxaK protein